MTFAEFNSEKVILLQSYVENNTYLLSVRSKIDIAQPQNTNDLVFFENINLVEPLCSQDEMSPK